MVFFPDSFPATIIYNYNFQNNMLKDQTISWHIFLPFCKKCDCIFRFKSATFRIKTGMTGSFGPEYARSYSNQPTAAFCIFHPDLFAVIINNKDNTFLIIKIEKNTLNRYFSLLVLHNSIF